jgi:uncharacterized surface anchored protein
MMISKALRLLIGLTFTSAVAAQDDDAHLYISGRVWVDTNGDGIHDDSLPGVEVTLYDEFGDQLHVETTDDFGSFEFFNVRPAKYKLVQKNLPGYTEVTDSEGSKLDSTITLDLTNGKSSYDNDFVDAPPQNVVAVTNPPNTPAYISGRVWSDTNNDSIGDEILPGVIVYLQDQFGNNIQTVSTDPQGLYEFFNVAPGRYTVRENNLPDFTDVSDTQGDAKDSAIVVDVANGAASYNNNFIDASPKTLAPTSAPVVQGPDPGTIDGHVYVRVPGGVAADDKILVGVVVSLLYADGSTFFDAGTNEEGYYLFTDVPDGKYTIAQRNFAGYTDVSNSAGTNSVNGTIPVEIKGGSFSINNNFVDAPPAELVAATLATNPPGAEFYISGRVWADVKGNGVDNVELAGVLVTLYDEDGDRLKFVTTDDFGLYEFFSLGPGNYTIVETNLAGYTEESDAEGSPTDSTIHVVLSDSSSYDNDFLDRPPSNVTQATTPPGTPTYISGRVWSDTDGDSVGDTVLAGVIVYLRDFTGNTTLMTASTDEQGLYEFFLVQPGKYSLTQTGLPGYTDVSDSQGDPLDSTIFLDLTDGKPSYGNNFVDAPPPLKPTGTISGTVTYRIPGSVADLQPLVGVVITLQNATGFELRDVGTDENGYYEFLDVKPGVYNIIQTNLPGYTDISDTTGDPLDGKISLELKKGDALHGNNFIDAPPAGLVGDQQQSLLKVSNITGKVLADTNGDGIGDVGLSGAEVALLDVNNETVYLTYTDDRGVYAFNLRIPSGFYHVIATNRADFVDVSDTSGSPTDNNILLNYVEGVPLLNNNFMDEPNATVVAGYVKVPVTSDEKAAAVASGAVGLISGSVMADTNGDNKGDTPLSTVRINLLDTSGQTLATVGTDDKGLFTFDYVPAGSYQISEVNPAGYTDVTTSVISVTLAAGKSATNNAFVDAPPPGAPTTSPLVAAKSTGAPTTSPLVAATSSTPAPTLRGGATPTKSPVGADNLYAPVHPAVLPPSVTAVEGSVNKKAAASGGKSGLSSGSVAGIVLIVIMLLILLGLFIRKQQKMRGYGYPSAHYFQSNHLSNIDFS